MIDQGPKGAIGLEALKAPGKIKGVGGVRAEGDDWDPTPPSAQEHSAQGCMGHGPLRMPQQNAVRLEKVFCDTGGIGCPEGSAKDGLAYTRVIGTICVHVRGAKHPRDLAEQVKGLVGNGFGRCSKAELVWRDVASCGGDRIERVLPGGALKACVARMADEGVTQLSKLRQLRRRCALQRRSADKIGGDHKVSDSKRLGNLGVSGFRLL